MTANRALRELRDEGVLVRIAGVGSFVADRMPMPIRSRFAASPRRSARAATCIAPRSCRSSACARSRELAEDFGVAPRSELYCSLIVHFENDLPVQLEDRYVSPQLAPDYLKVDFSRTTPYEYLSRSRRCRKPSTCCAR